jgi:hypothetical protein
LVNVGLVKVKFTTLNTKATHTLATISTPAPVIVAGALANGQTLVLPSNCTGTASGSNMTTPVTCDLGSVANSTTAPPILLEFQSPADCTGGTPTTPPCAFPFTASVTYSQGSLSSTESITASQNFQLYASSSATQAQPAVGNCPALSNGHSAMLSTLSSSLPQTAQVTFGPANSQTGDPCTPGAAGALNFPNGKPSNFVMNQVWFAELPQLDPGTNNGFATATLQVANLPSGTNKNNFVLKEFANDLFSGSFDATQYRVVPQCVGTPLQPPPAPPGQPAYDSCIVPGGVSNLPGGGLSINLILNPGVGDGSFSG